MAPKPKVRTDALGPGASKEEPQGGGPTEESLTLASSDLSGVALGRTCVKDYAENEDLPGDGIGYTPIFEKAGITVSMVQTLPIETQTLYAEALDRARLADMDRTFGRLTGGFGSKVVAGETFWYFRTFENGQGRKEFYIGRDTEDVRALMAQYEQQKAMGEATRSQSRRMAAMLTSGGCMLTDSVSAKVVESLSSGGFFRNGGVLVGTHAYVALGNLLGVRWKSAVRTQDLDFAAFRTMEVAAPQESVVDMWGTLDALNMGFLPTPGLNPRSPHTSYAVRGKEVKVDFLTTASRRGPFEPVLLPRFKAAALPLPYMDFLLENNTEALVLSGNAATLVKVPNPARYGLHKLLVASERPLVEQTKVAKDIGQASEMLTTLMELRAGEIDLAMDRMIEKNLAKKALSAAERFLGADSPIVNVLKDCN